MLGTRSRDEVERKHHHRGPISVVGYIQRKCGYLVGMDLPLLAISMIMEILTDSVNNQVLCFDPFSHKWTNPKCYGTIPSPRCCTASTIARDHVWLFGGDSVNVGENNELYKLDMIYLTWTEIATSLTKPQKRDCCSLNVLSEHQLVLHGGQSVDEDLMNDTWILDLPSLSWRLQCN